MAVQRHAGAHSLQISPSLHRIVAYTLLSSAGVASRWRPSESITVWWPDDCSDRSWRRRNVNPSEHVRRPAATARRYLAYCVTSTASRAVATRAIRQGSKAICDLHTVLSIECRYTDIVRHFTNTTTRSLIQGRMTLDSRAVTFSTRRRSVQISCPSSVYQMKQPCSLITSPAGAAAKYCDKYICVCVSVCLSVRISPEPHARSLPIFVACCLCQWLGPLWHVDDRPHCLSAGRGDRSAQRGQSVIYDCLVIVWSLTGNTWPSQSNQYSSMKHRKYRGLLCALCETWLQQRVNSIPVTAKQAGK